MAVCKTFPADAILEAYSAGQRLFGENRVQEFADKLPKLAELNDARFHMIGHLQSNKTAKAAEIFQAVDSIDSAKLAQRLNDSAQKLGKTLDVLIEINVGGEEAKSGLAPESPEIAAILSQATAMGKSAHSRAYDRTAVHGRSRGRAPVLPQACANCAMGWRLARFPGVTSTRFPWACRTTSRSPSKKALPACASAPPFSECVPNRDSHS